jgi:hypothetical protein
MEISPEIAKYFVDLGICGIGHVGILANRLRSKRSKFDVYLEHIISHSLHPLFAVGFMGLVGAPSEVLTPGWGASVGASTGIIYDGGVAFN